MALITSILTGGINNHETTSEEANGVVTDFVSEGVVGDITNTAGIAPATGGFAVNATGTPDTNVQITAGVAYVNGTPSSQNNQTFRVKNTSTATLAISANSSGSTKYDWIYIRLNATNLNAPNTAGDNVADIVASRSSSSSADDGTPPTYGYPIAVVTVANGFSSITNANIRDLRVESGLTPTPVTVSTASWTSAGATPSSIAYNGNRSYNLTWPINILGERSVGMRNRYTRSVTAPTQCADLESGSSQYFNRASAGITGMTFTDDFVVSAWIKLESYPSASTIVSRYNATNGWAFRIISDGRLRLIGYNGSSANYRFMDSSQSVPLGKWVHVAAQLDMSAFTTTPTTCYMMIDGVDVPAVLTQSGTNPSSLVQGGNLEVGSENGGTNLIDGKIAQVAIYSAKVTQANIRATISQGLTGSETSLISAYSLNGVLTDLNANANTLTAQGSATATATDSPFAGGDVLYNTDGTTEFSITTAISSDGLTETVQVPEGYAIPTTGGVSAVSYSTQKVPYGFPAARGKWVVQSHTNADATQATPTQNTWYNVGSVQLSVPIGEWSLRYAVNVYGVDNSGLVSAFSTLSTTNNGATDVDLTGRIFAQATGASATGIVSSTSRSKFVSLSATTPYYLNEKTDVSGQDSLQLLSTNGTTVIEAELALL